MFANVTEYCACPVRSRLALSRTATAILRAMARTHSPISNDDFDQNNPTKIETSTTARQNSAIIKTNGQPKTMPENSTLPMVDSIYKVPSRVLLGLGIYDLIRGFMHTFQLKWAGTNIAGFNPESTPMDQFFMLGTFGISNLLTGFIYLLISRRSPELSPYVLGLIPASYLLGLIGIWSNGIHGTSAYAGRYLLYVYFAICIGTLIYFAVSKRRD